MNTNIKSIKYISIVLLFVLQAYSEVTLKPKSVLKNNWESDSVYVGADIMAKENMSVIVTWEKTYGTRALGELYFIVPGSNDSLIFIFHNFIDRFPNEKRSVNLGTFPEGTVLNFLYTLKDTSQIYSHLYGKQIYSGQNREGIDQFISDRSNSIYGKRWTAACVTPDGKVELGFSEGREYLFENIMIKISGVQLVK